MVSRAQTVLPLLLRFAKQSDRGAELRAGHHTPNSFHSSRGGVWGNLGPLTQIIRQCVAFGDGVM